MFWLNSTDARKNFLLHLNNLVNVGNLERLKKKFIDYLRILKDIPYDFS